MMQNSLTVSGKTAPHVPVPRRNYTAALLKQCAAEGTLPEADLSRIRTDLHRAAAERAAAYTKGRSTTVTRAQAEAFYTSVLCQLDAVLLEMPNDAAAAEALRRKPLPELLEAGQLRSLQLCEDAKNDFRRAYRLTAPFETTLFHDLLKGFEAFCIRFDARFRAGDVKAEPVYPLLTALPEEGGLPGLAKYYHALLLEGMLLKLFDPAEIRGLMQRYALKYRTAPENIAENLAELVMRHTLTAMLCGAAPFSLHVTERMLHDLAGRFSPQPEAALHTALTGAADRLHTAPELREYLHTALPALTASFYGRLSGDRLHGWLAVTENGGDEV